MIVTPIAPDTILFRYMNFAEFVATLQGRSLWFTRLSEFKDKQEGQYYNRETEKKLLRQALAHHYKCSEEEVEPIVQNQGLYESFEKDAISVYTRSFANCWTIADEPTDLMWLAYAPTLGVAVQTTQKQLAECLPGLDVHKWDLTHGQCTYDPAEYKPLYQKRARFKDEKEYRVCYSIGYETGQAGCALPINLELLVSKVWISPHSGSDWLVDVVKKELELHCLPNVPVELDPH